MCTCDHHTVRVGISWRAEDTADVAAVEDLGFDSVWTGEHLLHPTQVTYDALVTLASWSARTRAILLGTSVLLLPLREPVSTAKAVASLCALAGARVILGIGVGGEFPEEFELVNIPINERGRRADDSLAAMRALWEGREHHGAFSRIPSVELTPRLPSPPPVWVGGRSPAAARRAGRLGNGFLPIFVDPPRYGRLLAVVRCAAEAAGRDAAGIEPALFQFVAVGPDRAAIRVRVLEELWSYYARDFTSLVDRYCTIGRPEQCASQLADLVDAGARHIVLVPIGARDRQQRLAAAEMFAAEVLPLLRAKCHHSVEHQESRSG